MPAASLHVFKRLSAQSSLQYWHSLMLAQRCRRHPTLQVPIVASGGFSQPNFLELFACSSATVNFVFSKRIPLARQTDRQSASAVESLLSQPHGQLSLGATEKLRVELQLVLTVVGQARTLGSSGSGMV